MRSLSQDKVLAMNIEKKSGWDKENCADYQIEHSKSEPDIVIKAPVKDAESTKWVAN